MLMGLSRPPSGQVRVFGQHPTDPEVRRRIGYHPGRCAGSPPATAARPASSAPSWPGPSC
ncbi:hypothetical protein [Streptomyces cyaneofuscatus]|uniref:hypothetical protein n=1 Tax=Streptomyces cyaneofuscatus TaxID=66883 RepID=UPI0037AD9768